MKVYGGIIFVHGKQVRAVVACKRSELYTFVGGKAAKAYAKNYWTQTGNSIEVGLALSNPGVLFYRDNNVRGNITEKDYHRLKAQP